MRKHDFIVAYDIADPKRLSKAAKILEGKAMRIQYSIFYLVSISKKDAMDIFENLVEVCDSEEDDLRIYKIQDKGIHMGSAVDLRYPFDFFGEKL